MPFTFFAHQAPLLPLVRRWRRLDGVALLVGSMSPDFAYALAGTRFHVWAHAFPALLTFCVPATLAVSWIVVRVLAAVVPRHLPEFGGFHLHEYGGLAVHRFGLVVAPLCAFLGAVSHVVLDGFTHEWGWMAQHVPAYREALIDGSWLGRPWTAFRLVQYAGHVGLSGASVWLLWRYGRRRWFAARAAQVPVPDPSPRSHLLLWGSTALGLGLAALWAPANPRDTSALILRLAGGAFAGMTLGALLVRRVDGRAPGECRAPKSAHAP